MAREPNHSKQIQVPALPIGSPPGEITSVSLTSEFRYSDAILKHAILSGQSANSPELARMILDHVRANGTSIPGIVLSDVRILTSDLSNAEWPNAIVHRTLLTSCKLTGIQLTDAYFQNTVFDDCVSPFARFLASSMSAVKFDKCNLSDADFRDADLKGVVFKDCDLKRADLRGAKLAGTDFRGSILDGVQVLGSHQLRGAIVDPMQAAYLACLDSTLGLQVKWD